VTLISESCWICIGGIYHRFRDLLSRDGHPQQPDRTIAVAFASVSQHYCGKQYIRTPRVVRHGMCVLLYLVATHHARARDSDRTAFSSSPPGRSKRMCTVYVVPSTAPKRTCQYALGPVTITPHVDKRLAMRLHQHTTS